MSYPLATNTWGKDELQAIQSVIDRGTYTMSDSVSQFEQDFTKYINRKYCIMVSSGSAANLIATAALFYTKNPMLKSGDEVIVPTLTFIAPINAVSYNNAKPVFMDADNYYNIDVEKTAEYIKNKTVFKNGFSYNKITNKIKVKRKINKIIQIYIYINKIKKI